MVKLDTNPYKGVRDFYPEDLRFRKWLFSKWRKVAERYGYVEYDASVLEPAELYRSKTSEEIVNEQTYTFTDRGDREVTLRPEMTPTVGRMVAGKRRELGFPLRWYSIPNVFRYESPQKGRLREHFQFNADIFGVSEIDADVEIIQLAYETMISLGAKDSDFEIRVNSRKLLARVYEPILKNQEDLQKALRLEDKAEKMNPKELEDERNKLFSRPFEKQDAQPKNSPELERVMEKLDKLGIKTKFDFKLIRGFDYYTDIIFEVFDTDPNNRRSLFGGGRYDNLLQMFGEEKVPAVGIAMGDVTAKDFLETHGLMPELKNETNIALLSFGNTDVSSVADTLRDAGLNIAVDNTEKDISDKKRNAEKNNIPFYIVVGENEITSGKFELKNILTKNVFSGTLQEISEQFLR